MPTTETLAVNLLSASVTGTLALAPFHREYRRDARWVVDLADSMYHHMRIGEVVLWKFAPISSGSSPADAVDPYPLTYLADGHHRVTAICLLFGMKPAWIARKTWDRLAGRNEILVDVTDTGNVCFTTQSGRRTSTGLVPTTALLGCGADTREVGQTYGITSAAGRVALATTREKLRAFTLSVAQQTGDMTTARRGFLRSNNSGRSLQSKETNAGPASASGVGRTTRRATTSSG